jgi:hypothetical protein
MRPPFPWSGGGLLAQAGCEQLRDPPPPGRRGGASVLRGSSVAAAVQRRARGISRLPSPCGGSAGCLRRGEILIVGARPTMGRARSASDLFKMLNPNTCVFRDFGRRGSQSQGKAKNADCCKQHVSFFAPPHSGCSRFGTNPRTKRPPFIWRAFKKDISRHARLKNRGSFFIADFGLTSVAIGTANRGRRRNARPSLPPAGPLRAGRFRTTT